MAGVDGRVQEFGPADDGFHLDSAGDDWWATETSWFSFHHPGRGLGGWLYTMVRPNIGTVAGGVWVWDASSALPWEALYNASYTSLPLASGSDLRDVVLPTGVGVRMLDPGMRYALAYDDPGRLRVDLEFVGVMAPRPLTTGGSTFGRASHFDQIGAVTGTVEVLGEVLEIDCLAVRDRTWGRRPEDRPRRAVYLTGAATPTDGFVAVTRHVDGAEVVSYGFLLRSGRAVDLVSGVRRVVRDEANGWITAIEVDLVDVEGRTASLVGHAVSRIIVNRHTFIDVNSLVRWDMDGLEAWGEDQDMWPVHDWAAFRRTARPGAGS